MKTALLCAALLATSALLAGCGDDDPKMSATPAPAKATTTIRISNFLYEPESATVKPGAKVSITNADSAPHTVTDKGAGKTFDSGTIKGGRSGTVTFSKPGTYAYFCEFHATMAGKVVVKR